MPKFTSSFGLDSIAGAENRLAYNRFATTSLAEYAKTHQSSLGVTDGDSRPDPWAAGGSVIGGVIGAILGGGAGGLGGAAGGTLVAPGIGTIGGAVGVGLEGVAIGGATGATVGYGIGAMAHTILNRSGNPSAADSELSTTNAQKPDPNAVRPFQNDPAQLRGRPSEKVEKMLDEQLVNKGHWIKSTSRDGNGIRYIDGKGGSVIINRGYPDELAGGDAVHQGPYIKIQPGNIRVPLAGNPAAGN